MGYYVVERKSAFGDVIASTAIATHLKRLGHQVHFLTSEMVKPILEGHPHIDKLGIAGRLPPDINLNNIEAQQKTRHLQDCYAEFAAAAIPKLRKADFPIIRPTLPHFIDVEAQVLKQMAVWPHPWIVVCPGSWQAPNRTVPSHVWQRVAEAFPHATFFNPTRDKIGGRFINVGDSYFKGLMAAVNHSDLVLTVDSGPMHVADAYGKLMIVVEQAWPVDMRLSSLENAKVFKCGLPCSPCRDHSCELPGAIKATPACQAIDVDKFIQFVKDFGL
jgi:ADP-heptose:LPS heptosyltransferase